MMHINLKVSKVRNNGTYDMSIDTDLVSSDVVVKILKDAIKNLEGSRVVKNGVKTYGDPNDGPI